MKALHNIPDCIERQVNQRLLLSHWPENEEYRSILDTLETSIKRKTAKILGPEREQMEYLLEISKLYEKIFSNDTTMVEVGVSEARGLIGRMVVGEGPYMLNIFILRELLAISSYRLAALQGAPEPLIESIESYWELSKSTRIPSFLANFQSLVEDARSNPQKFGIRVFPTQLDNISDALRLIPDPRQISADIQKHIDNQIAEFRKGIITGG